MGDLETPWSLRVVATLHIAEHIAAGKSDVEDLAEASESNADSLLRVMRHLASRGVFEEPTPAHFALNDAARGLLDSSTKLGFDLEGIGGRMAEVWCSLLTAVRTGTPAYHKVFGRPFWEDLHAHPNIASSFDDLMAPAGHGIPDPDVLLNDDDWNGVRSVTDVGGGTGALLVQILQAHPTVRGTLVDLPSTVARSVEVFRAGGMSDRVTTSAQSFFDPLPPGSDVYVLKNVLPDWPDADAQRLLTRLAEAAPPSGRVVVLGGIAPDERPAPSPELLMMVLVGGKQRSLSEFRALAAEAGLAVDAHGKRPGGRFIVECRRCT
jgi:hypothetical protein